MIKLLLSAALMLCLAFYLMPSDQQVKAIQAQQTYEQKTATVIEQRRISRSIINDKEVIKLAGRVKADLERGELNPAWYIMDRLVDQNPDIQQASLAESGEITLTNETNDVKVSCAQEQYSGRWSTVCMATSMNGKDFFERIIY